MRKDIQLISSSAVYGIRSGVSGVRQIVGHRPVLLSSWIRGARRESRLSCGQYTVNDLPTSDGSAIAGPFLVLLTIRTSAGKLIPRSVEYSRKASSTWRFASFTCSLESMAIFSRSFSDITHRSVQKSSTWWMRGKSEVNILGGDINSEGALRLFSANRVDDLAEAITKEEQKVKISRA